MMSNITKFIQDELKQLSDPLRAEHSQKFFKTNKGEYGEGDVFRGVSVPKQRNVSKKYKDANTKEVFKLLKSKYHEDRLTALFILVLKFKKGNDSERKLIYKNYLKNTHQINNWDLVDSSAHQIIGAYLFDKDRTTLYKLAHSKLLWERRISIIATYHFIRKEDFADTMKLSEILLKDREDLMHKAVGWMLREVGNRNFELENEFLRNHYKKMPRTMLRYAIEKFPPELRIKYINGTI